MEIKESTSIVVSCTFESKILFRVKTSWLSQKKEDYEWDEETSLTRMHAAWKKKIVRLDNRKEQREPPIGNYRKKVTDITLIKI